MSPVWLGPLFPDALELEQNLMSASFLPEHYRAYAEDWRITGQFLLAYKDSPQTFKSYRRDVERFLLWLWGPAAMSLAHLERPQVQQYLDFIRQVPKAWCMSHHQRRYLASGINPQWRPFLVAQAPRDLAATLAILSTYCAYLVDMDYLAKNPVKQLKTKRHLVRSNPSDVMMRVLSSKQWEAVMACCQETASWRAQRNIWMLKLFYFLGLRISELAVTPRHVPSMSDFYQDAQGATWLRVVGKGNKVRDVAVPDAILRARDDFRAAQGWPLWIEPSERRPLIPKRGHGQGLGVRQIRALITECFLRAQGWLRERQYAEEAERLQHATVHFLRHTAISRAVKYRPLEHVRDDVGHGNLMTTNIYVHSNKAERHRSAQLVEDPGGPLDES